MCRLIAIVTSMALVGAGLGCQSMGGSGGAEVDSEKTAFLLEGDYLEGCECSIYCPCIFSKDASGGDCRAVMGFKIRHGHAGSVDVSGLPFAVSLTKSGPNVDKAIGKLEGVIFVPQKASDAQRVAISDSVKKAFAGVFSRMEVRAASIEVESQGETSSLKVGGVATLKVTALKGASGQVPVILNAPSPLAFPKLSYAQADTNQYDDGTTQWDFAGHNGFYGPFQFKG